MGSRRDAARIDGLAAHGEPRARRPTGGGGGVRSAPGAAPTKAPGGEGTAPFTSLSAGDVGGGRGAVYPVATMNQPLGTGDMDAWAATISKQNG